MLYGRVSRGSWDGEDEWTLTIYSRQAARKRVRRLAVVVGSAAYIQLALAAALAGNAGLAKDRDWRQSTFVSSQPAHRNTKRSR